MRKPTDIMKDSFELNDYRLLGSLIIVSGASGTGKSTLCKKLMTNNPDIVFSISCTTRAPRTGEVHGKDYFFVTKDEFNDLIKANNFMEYANVHGNYYGTLKSEVIDRLNTGKNILLDIDVQGAMIIKEKFKDDPIISSCMEYLFILPPSLTELENRLRNRKTDTDEVIQKRLCAAKNEIDQFVLYDYFIVNDNLPLATERLQLVIDSFKSKVKRLGSFSK